MKNTSLKKSLSIATAIMMTSVLLSRITGLVREQVLAHFGGTSFQMDAYVTAFLIPELLNHFLAGGFLSITFIPIFQRYIIKGEMENAWRSFSNLLTIGSILFAILIPVSVFYAPQIMGLLGSHITDPRHMALTVRLTRIILPAQIFFYWGAFFSAIQMANHRFFFPALSPLCYNLGIILGGIFLGPVLGIEGFAWGVLIGAFIGNVVVQLPGIIKCGVKFSPRFNIFDRDLIEYTLKTIPLILGLGMTFSNEIFFRFFGSFLPEGSTSSVNYALRTTMMVVAVFGQASGVAFFPFLSRMAAEKQFEKMAELLNTVLLKIGIYLIPLSCIMIVLSKQIISVLFEHGRFSSQSTIETSGIFSVYLIGTFAFSASIIVARTFYAMQNTLLPMIISTITSAISIPLYIYFSRLFGGKGIALAAITGITLQFAILYIIWCFNHNLWKSALDMFVKLLKITIIGAVAACLGFLIKSHTGLVNIPMSKLMHSLFICTVAGIPSLLAAAALYELTGLQKVSTLIKGLLRK